MNLGISDFITRGNQAVSKFESVVSQILKNESDIDSKLQSIAMANLLKCQALDKSMDLPGSTNSNIFFMKNHNHYIRIQGLFSWI